MFKNGVNLLVFLSVYANFLTYQWLLFGPLNFWNLICFKKIALLCFVYDEDLLYVARSARSVVSGIDIYIRKGYLVNRDEIFSDSITLVSTLYSACALENVTSWQPDWTELATWLISEGEIVWHRTVWSDWNPRSPIRSLGGSQQRGQPAFLYKLNRFVWKLGSWRDLALFGQLQCGYRGDPAPYK